jgi:hypothetical protein
MLELRWVTFGKNCQLEYRERHLVTNNWGDLRSVSDWSEWKTVPTIDGNEAAYEDLRASGGL